MSRAASSIHESHVFIIYTMTFMNGACGSRQILHALFGLHMNISENKSHPSLKMFDSNSCLLFYYFFPFWLKIIVIMKYCSSAKSYLRAFSVVQFLTLNYQRHSNVKNNYCCQAFCVRWSRITRNCKKFSNLFRPQDYWFQSMRVQNLNQQIVKQYIVNSFGKRLHTH